MFLTVMLCLVCGVALLAVDSFRKGEILTALEWCLSAVLFLGSAAFDLRKKFQSRDSKKEQ